MCRPNLFQHYNTSGHKVTSMMHATVRVEDLECPAQSPNFNPVKHLSDELELKMHPRPSRLTLVADLTNTFMGVFPNLHSHASNLMKKLAQRRRGYYNSKGRLKSHMCVIGRSLNLCLCITSVCYILCLLNTVYSVLD